VRRKVAMTRKFTQLREGLHLKLDDEPEPEPEPEPAGAAQKAAPTETAAQAERRERRVVNTIALMSVLVWGGNMLAMQAEHEVVSTATVCPSHLATRLTPTVAASGCDTTPATLRSRRGSRRSSSRSQACWALC